MTKLNPPHVRIPGLVDAGSHHTAARAQLLAGRGVTHGIGVVSAYVTTPNPAYIVAPLPTPPKRIAPQENA